MNDRPISIGGGAGPMQAAAIVAVVQFVLDEEAAARSRLPARRLPTAWVRLGSAQTFGRFAPPIVPGAGHNTPQ